MLNYIATSNHIHLLVVDTGEETIPKSLQLIAGRTAQEYNIRKKRKGAFWEDRYHATAVQTDEHLVKCLIYIDLNMVRAGVVRHPSEYGISGYNEIQNPSERYAVVDRPTLRGLFAIDDEHRFQQTHREWVEVELTNKTAVKNSIWTESVAVGSENFVNDIQRKLAGRGQGSSVTSHNGVATLKEPQGPYNDLSADQNRSLRPSNGYLLQTDREL